VIKTGPFFEEVPGEGDLYVLKHVAQDWHDEAAKAVLRRVRAAICRRKKRPLLLGTVLPPLKKVISESVLTSMG
jgi:hypothetical protein